MKIVRFKLSADTQKLTMKVTDILGNEYTINRTGYIDEHYYPEHLWDLFPMEFDDVKSTFLGSRTGIQVANGVWVLLAKVEFVKSEAMHVTKEAELKYRWFKPQLKHTDKVKCEEATSV